MSESWTVQPCFVCWQTQAKKAHPSFGDYERMECSQCGEYTIDGTTTEEIHHLDAESRINLSGWIFEQNQIGEKPSIGASTLELARTMRRLRVGERAGRLLRAIVMSLPRWGEEFSILTPQFISASYSADQQDLDFVAGFLEEGGLIESITSDGQMVVTYNGYLEYEKLLDGAPDTPQAFVAMWFSDELREAYEVGFAKGVIEAGYDPVRVDRVEHAGKIDDEIIAQIRRSRFVVADFTGHRGGVYFEAGFAMGLNLPVIFTCQKGHLKELHFDVRQYNTIDWSSHDELAERLEKRIAAVIGDGPRRRR